jgi:hypothetical protein
VSRAARPLGLEVDERAVERIARRAGANEARQVMPILEPAFAAADRVGDPVVVSP